MRFARQVGSRRLAKEPGHQDDNDDDDDDDDDDINDDRRLAMMMGGGDSHDYDDCNVGDNNDDDDDNDDRRLAKEPEYQNDAKKTGIFRIRVIVMTHMRMILVILLFYDDRWR